MRLLLNWLLSAISLLIVSRFIPGFYVRDFTAALIAALVIGLVNATLGLFLKIITLPLTIFTLGIFWWVINALMLIFASNFVPGFAVHGFWPAFWRAVCASTLTSARMTRKLALFGRSALIRNQPACVCGRSKPMSPTSIHPPLNSLTPCNRSSWIWKPESLIWKGRRAELPERNLGGTPQARHYTAQLHQSHASIDSAGYNSFGCPTARRLHAWPPLHLSSKPNPCPRTPTSR